MFKKERKKFYAEFDQSMLRNESLIEALSTIESEKENSKEL
jgi:hypothetical protein